MEKFEKFCLTIFPNRAALIGDWPFDLIEKYPEAWGFDLHSTIIARGKGVGLIAPSSYDAFQDEAILLVLPPIRNYEVKIKESNRWNDEKKQMIDLICWLGLQFKKKLRQ